MTNEENLERYAAALHAMQSGVAMAMALSDTAETEPKHLRVGVNSSLLNDAAIARLLIDRGIFTEEEYVGALADQMEFEQQRYERRLGVKLA